MNFNKIKLTSSQSCIIRRVLSRLCCQHKSVN